MGIDDVAFCRRNYVAVCDFTIFISTEPLAVAGFCLVFFVSEYLDAVDARKVYDDAVGECGILYYNS